MNAMQKLRYFLQTVRTENIQFIYTAFYGIQAREAYKTLEIRRDEKYVKTIEIFFFSVDESIIKGDVLE